MASLRITWNSSTNQNQFNSACTKLRNVVQGIQNARKDLSELKLVLDKFNADFTSMATELGLSSSGDATSVYNLVVQAYGELNALATTQVSVGGTTGSRQLVDALG